VVGENGLFKMPCGNGIAGTADGGGGNGTRVRCGSLLCNNDWPSKRNYVFSVCHFPPGTSKWNKIERRMFSYISLNWRGKPLISLEVIVNLIAGTSTRTGLEIQAELDTIAYPKGIQVTDEELEKVQIQKADFYGE
jgi:hypothetical protein